MNALKECFNTVEYFSPFPGINFGKNAKISSWSTKICSVLALALYLGLIVNRVFNWFTNTSFTTKYSLSTQPKTKTVTVDRDLIDFEVSALETTKENYFLVHSVEPIENVDSANKSRVIGQSTVLPGKDRVHFKMEEDMKLGGNRATGDYFTAETEFSFETPSKQGITLIFDYKSYFIKQNKPEDGLDSVNSEEFFDLSTEFDYNVEVLFMKVNLDFSINLLFSIGEKIKHDFSFVKEIRVKQAPKAKIGFTTCTVSFQPTNDEVNYSIEYEHFDSVLAKISAIRDFVLVVGNVLLGLFNQGVYEAYIAKCCFSFSPDQNEVELGNEYTGDTDLIDQTVKKRVKVSFCDSIRVFCFGKTRNSLSRRMFDLVEDQFDVLEIVKRQIYIDILRRKQAEQSNSLSDSKDRSTANIY